MPQLIAGAAIAGGVSSIFTAGSFFSVFATTIAAGFLGQVLTPLPSNLNNGAPQNRQVGGRSTESTSSMYTLPTTFIVQPSELGKP